MARISPKDLDSEQYEVLDEALRNALEQIAKRGDVTLLHNLLTEGERVMIARRIQIAKELMRGQKLKEIRNQLGVGFATIEGVDRWLRKHFSDYRSVLPGLFEEMRKQARRKKPIEPQSLRAVRKQYPLHSFIFNLLLDDIDWDPSHGKKRQPAYKSGRQPRKKQR